MHVPGCPSPAHSYGRLLPWLVTARLCPTCLGMTAPSALLSLYPYLMCNLPALYVTSPVTFEDVNQCQ